MESHECPDCRKDPGYKTCSACKGVRGRCIKCGGTGKERCPNPKCNHGRIGELAGTTLDLQADLY